MKVLNKENLNSLKDKTINLVKNNRKKSVAIALVFVLIVTCTSVFRSSSKRGNAMAMTKLPDVSSVSRGAMDQRVSASGTTVAADINEIFIELSQEVKDVYAEVGDEVEEGQLLVTYDIDDTKRELENKLQDAEITLENAQLTLSELVTPASGTELIDLKSAVTSAEKTLTETQAEIESLKLKITQSENSVKTAENNFENTKTLFQVGGVTQAECDSAEETYNNAVLTLKQNRDSLTAAEQSLTSAELSLEKAKLNLENGQNKYNDISTANSIKKQQNTVATAQTNYETAQENLSKLTEATYSPISGTIITSNAVEGQMLTDSTVMMEIADLTNLDLEAYVSEYDIAKVKVGQKVELTSDGVEGVTYHGTVIKIEPTASSQTTISGSEIVVPIVVHFEDNDELVKPGFTFDMEIIVVDLPEDTEYIPISSIMKDKETGETYVYEVDSNETLKKTVVELGTYSDMYAELLGGLGQDSRFVTSPVDEMKEGTALSDYATQSAEPSAGKNTEESSSLLNMGGGNNGGGGASMGGGGGPMR